jgi:lysozyme
VPTIGWGHTAGVQLGDTCTQAQADAWFQTDALWAGQAILRTVDVALTQNQFDALVSFTFNVGVGAEAASTLLKVLNAGNYQAAADQFLRWDHVNGVVDPGLTRRRQAEQALFLS